MDLLVFLFLQNTSVLFKLNSCKDLTFIMESDDESCNSALQNLMELKNSAVEDSKEKMKEREEKGVVYMSFVPPHVNPNTVRRLLASYKIDRIYLSREEEWKKESRIKTGGS